MSQIPNYSLNIDPGKALLQGLQAGAGFRQTQEKTGLIQQKRAQAQATQDALFNYSQIEEPTAEQTADLITRQPQLSEDFKRNFDLLNAKQQKASLSEATNIYSALRTGDNETAKRILEQKRDGALNAGLDDDAKKAEIMLKNIENNPKAALVGAEIGLASVMGADKFAKLKESTGGGTGEEGQFRVLNKDEKNKLGLTESESFQISPEGKVSKIGGGGININLPVKPSAGFKNVFDDQGRLVRQEIIEGGPVDIKAKKLVESEIAKKKKSVKEGEVFIEESEKLIDIIKDAPFFSPVAGVMSKNFFPGIRQNRVNAEALLTSLKGRIGFNELQAMRDASPTGGALGQVSERELEFLQGALRSLSLAQSEDQLVKNLRSFNRDFNEIVHGDQFGSYRQKPEVVKLEQRLGRPLNAEEFELMFERGKL